MAEEGAATATAESEAGKQPDGTGSEGTKPDGASTTTADEGKLGPEGEKALEAFKTRARSAEKQAKELQERLDKMDEANKSESEKALDQARKEARTEAEKEFEKERRSDRLAVAIAGHARDLADVDDVVLNIERRIASGDAEVFDKEGKVEKDALKKALDGLLKDKPHLKATGAGKPSGDADGGKGEGGEGRSFNDEIRRQAAGRT